MGSIILLITVTTRSMCSLKLQIPHRTNFHAHNKNNHSVSTPRFYFQNHHNVANASILDYSDSIDRIEVVRFDPRGTLRSTRRSILASDSDDRNLNSYYG